MSTKAAVITAIGVVRSTPGHRRLGAPILDQTHRDAVTALGVVTTGARRDDRTGFADLDDLGAGVGDTLGGVRTGGPVPGGPQGHESHDRRQGGEHESEQEDPGHRPDVCTRSAR